ncbi:hypothetical protein [Primorskyibacter marinus]|uniref:hypothetical protein n=1 Tax=Primorskyibacter marinus TaxID=1977320 RepID=UPI002FCDD8AD
MHADGFTGLNGLFGADRASEQACMVHMCRSSASICARSYPKGAGIFRNRLC